MRNLFLSLALLGAGLGWPALVSAADPADAGFSFAGIQVPAPSQPAASGALRLEPSGSLQAPSRQGSPPTSQAPGVNPTSVCGYQISPPANLPPAGSGPVVYQIVMCFPKQENKPVVDPLTYQYYIQLPRSTPSKNQWTPWDANAEKMVMDDFKRLWATTFLDDLSIETLDYWFANGILGKLVVYNMEERQKVKIVDYEGNKHVETTKIDDKLKEENIQIRIDNFIDESVIKKVKGVIQALEAEKGYEFATVTPEVKPIEGQIKTVHLTFRVDEVPKVGIRRITFVGNKAISSRALRRQMKNNKAHGWLSFITSKGIFQREKYEEDADKVVSYYRDHGYVGIRVGDPELRYIEDSRDRTTRWIDLQIPVSEGERFKVASLNFDGNKVVKSEALRALFKIKPGDWYSDKPIRKGMEKAQELYGSVGYWQFTGYPELTPEGQAKPREQEPPKSGQPGTDTGAAPAAGGDGAAAANAQQGAPPAAGQEAGSPAAPEARPDGKQQQQGPPSKPAVSVTLPARKGPPRVEVTMRMQEGKQYFVHRIIFEGNTTTRDNVVRRELRLYEGGVFNTEALKYSVKRINQLGYFKNLEGEKDLKVDTTPDTDNQVDVTLKVQEQNRNQITFGAGVSQYEGFFGQIAFQTANFMGRGETFNVSLQAGSLAQLYQVGFTEPFLFDRNMTGGINLFRRRLNYLNQFTEASTGGDLTFGFQTGAFSRMFVNYSYARTRVDNVNPIFLTPEVLAANPYLQESLLVAQSGSRTVSKIAPTYLYNSIDNPIFPTSGKRFTATVDLAGIGGNTNFYKPTVEGVWYHPFGSTAGGRQPRTSVAFRAQVQYLAPFSGPSTNLPIFEKLVLGGEYSVRGFDLRSIGPKAAGSDLVIGGNKSLLFNAEYLIAIAGPVRLVLFADAGQVRDFGEKFAMNQFKTSTGAEVRFFMPVLNVPFRLIFAANPNRSGILDNSFLPQKAFTFRFAVGSTF